MRAILVAATFLMPAGVAHAEIPCPLHFLRDEVETMLGPASGCRVGRN